MKTVKLMIPVVLTMIEQENNESNLDTCFPNLWMRSFPRCHHEKEKIVESWQALEILPMIITDHHDQIVTAYSCSSPHISEQFILAANSTFSVLEEGETEFVDYDYFTEKYEEHIWLIVYCRKCSSIFYACGL